MEWFRLYSEMIGDAKIKRLARQLKRSTAEIVGVWVTMLAFASESPRRGALFLGEGVPVMIDDIDDAAGIATDEIVAGFESMRMIERVDDAWQITHWDQRQFASDDVTQRVRRHRETKQTGNVSQPEDETLQERFGNAIETPSDTDTDTDTETKTEIPLGGPDGPDLPATSETMAQKFQSLLERLRGEKNKPATLREIYCLCFGEGDAPDFGYLGRVAREVGGAGRLAELMWQLVPRPPTGDKLAYIQAQHKRTEAAAPPTRREKSQAAIKNALMGGSNGHARAGSAIIDLTGRDVSE